MNAVQWQGLGLVVLSLAAAVFVAWWLGGPEAAGIAFMVEVGCAAFVVFLFGLSGLVTGRWS